MIPGLRHQIKSYEMLREISGVIQDLRAEVSALRKAEAIRAIENEWSQNERYQDRKRLRAFEFQVNSQNGEDGIIAEIFRRIGTTDRYFVEIGLEDGKESNTAFLLACGWSGLWIDGGDQMHATIADKGVDIEGRLQLKTAYVTAENIPSIFEEENVSKEFDLLSVDIDQNTYFAWKALQNYQPRVVVVEYNSAIPPDVEWKVEYSPERTWNGTINMGASLKALEILGSSLGYALVGCDFTGTNAFFVRNDLTEDHFSRPYSADNHFEPSRLPLNHYRSHKRDILDFKETR